MGVITHGGTLPDSANKTDFYEIIDTATIAGIVNADISNAAAIADTKLATISTASKVSGASLSSLASIPAGAGEIPATNLPAIPGGTVFAITPTSGDGTLATELTFISAIGTVSSPGRIIIEIADNAGMTVNNYSAADVCGNGVAATAIALCPSGKYYRVNTNADTAYGTPVSF